MSQLSLVLRSHGERPRNPRIIITPGIWMRVLDDRLVYFKRRCTRTRSHVSSKCIFAKGRNVLKPTPGLWLRKSITKRSCFRHQRFNGDVESIGFMEFSEKTLVGQC